MGVVNANAQDIFKKGSFVGNVGIGFGNLSWGGDGSYGGESSAAFQVSGEYGIMDNLINGNNGSIGVGAVIGYGGKSWDYVKLNNVLVGALGSFHYQFIPKLDTYGTLTLGLNFQNWKWDGDEFWGGDNKESNVAFQPEIHVGARYYFTNNFAAMAEVGYGLSIFSVGISYKF